MNFKKDNSFLKPITSEYRKMVNDYFGNLNLVNPSIIRYDNQQFIDLSLKNNLLDTAGTLKVYEKETIRKNIENFIQTVQELKLENQTAVNDVYLEDDEITQFNSDDDENTVSMVTRQYDGTYYLKMNVSNFYFPFLVGRQKNNLRKLEQKCDVRIVIPSVDSNLNEIELIGQTERLVLSAKRILDIEIAKIHANQEPNYFLSIVINNSDIKQNYLDFKKKICSGDYVKDLDTKIVEEMFMPVEKLHLTIGMLKLIDNSEKSKAIRIFTECNDTILKPYLERNGPIEFHLHGVDTFEDDPANVRVIFAKVVNKNDEKHEKLQEIVNLVYNHFESNGLIDDSNGPKSVKMHVTLMNTRYVKNRESFTMKTFNAQNILNTFSKFQFGLQQLHSLHLSSRYTLSRTGYYGTLI